MADQTFHFPASGQTHILPDGRTLYIKIYYDSGGGATNTNTDTYLNKISPLKFDMDMDLSSDELRFNYLDIEFYNIGDVFENEAIINAAYDEETFIEIEIDGSLWWKGVMDQTKIIRRKYRLSSGSLVYDLIKIRFIDVIKYFWDHAIDFADFSHANGDTMDTVFQDIGAEVGLAAGEVEVSANFTYTEDSGVTYDSSDFRFNGYATATLVSAFLKDFMLTFACWIFFWDGKLRVIPRGGGAAQALNDDYILKMKWLWDYQKVRYYKVEADKDWSGITGAGPSTTQTETNEGGDSGVDAENQFIYNSGEGLADTICVIGTEYLNSYGVPDSAVANTEIRDAAENFITDVIEVGDRVRYTDTGAATAYSIVKNVAYDGGLPLTTITFYPISVAVDDSLDYDILEAPGNKRYKIYKIMELAGAWYNEYFLTSVNALWVHLRDIDTHEDFDKKFTLLGKSWKIKSFDCFIVENEIKFTLIEIT